MNEVPMKIYLKKMIELPIILVAAALLLASVSTASSDHSFNDGDIILQHLPSQLSSVIADVSESIYSHCGMIVHKKDEPYVIEAIGPVLYTPLQEWINRGTSGKYTLLRPKNLSESQIIKVLNESRSFLGKPYDIQYEMDEEKIYCSELVYKSFLRGCNIEIGKKQTLGSLKWQPHEDFIRHIAKGELPLKRIMVTPESLIHSRNVRMVYTSFLPEKKSTTYDTDILSGTWRGDYTIRGLNKAIATLTLGKNGTFISGYISHNSLRVAITSFEVNQFSADTDFQATLKDSRQIEAGIKAEITDNGNKIIGTWHDTVGYSGIFSLSKQ